jgi:hypothetical protein
LNTEAIRPKVGFRERHRKMPTSPLPREIISLIHYTELNKSGWWNKSVQQLILSALWLADKPTTENELRKSLADSFHIQIALGRLKAQSEQLINAGSLVRLPAGELKVSEPSRKKLEDELRSADELTAKAKDRFAEVFKNFCPSLDVDEQWTVFHTRFLFPLVREIGARTYQLISGGQLDLNATGRFPDFLAAYAVQHHQGLRNAVISFLDPSNDHVRAYVLRHLNAYFCLEASSLDQATIDGLMQSLKNPPAFKIFVDTNFLFSFLDLHENPSNEAAKSLVQLTKQLEGRALCKFYVSAETMDEFKRVVNAQRDFLQGLVLPPNLAQAAIEMDLSAIAQRFVEFSKSAGQPISAEAYFRPYLSDLIPTLRDKQVEFFNESMKPYSMRQDIIDDILQQQQHEKKRYGARAKSYEQLRHDVVLWHFVAEKRPARVESPVEATYWIVTVDYHFLGFDLYKRTTEQSLIPICLHPSSLIQLLQFWLPRTREFEDAIMDSLRLPLLFQEFDSSAERVTVQILETLARFEKVEQLSTDVVSSILVNQALRQEIALEPDVQKQVDLVKNALVEENERARRHLEEVRQETERLNTEVSDKNRVIDQLQSQLAEQGQRVRQLEEQTQRTENTEVVAAATAPAMRYIDAQTQILYFSTAAIFLLLFLLLASPLLSRIHGYPADPTRARTVMWAASAFIWVLAVDWSGGKSGAVRSWSIFVKFHEFKVWLLSLIGFVIGWQIVEKVGGTVLDWAKTILHLN